MIDRLLENQLKPIARDYWRWQLWRALAVCWAVLAAAGGGALLLHQWTGWRSAWFAPLYTLAAIAWVFVVLRRWRGRRPDYRDIARRIEQEDPKLHALLLTAVEQHPDAATGRLHYLQERVVREALEHNRRRPWANRTFERLFFTHCAHGLALVCFLGVWFSLRVLAPPGASLFHLARNNVTVTPGDTQIERGGGLVVLARFEGKLPAEATLAIKPVNEPERRIPLAKNLDDPVYGGSVPEVNAELTYRVEYAGGPTRDYKVSVFDYPKLERADARLTYPAYTGLPGKTIADTRRVSAVEGTALDYAFFLNKPVTAARLVAKDKSVIALSVETNHPAIYHFQTTLDQSRQYELQLVDDAGRTNKVPPQFVLEALKNRPPELKFAFPRGDLRVSPLEEIAFQAEAADDFGLKAYGIAYTLAGQETRFVELGKESGPNEKRTFQYLLPLESLGAQPERLLSYYIWADDTGPDGATRRTSSDMYFAEVRPFDEIFREGQEGGGGGGGQQGAGNQTQKLAELQKQIINATWTLHRNKAPASRTDHFE